MYRRLTRAIPVGNRTIGGDAPITIQSMTNCPAADFDGTVAQIRALEKAGCDIVRMAVPREEDAQIFTYAKKAGITLPLVADIHFDYKIALTALRCGAGRGASRCPLRMTGRFKYTVKRLKKKKIANGMKICRQVNSLMSSKTNLWKK